VTSDRSGSKGIPNEQAETISLQTTAARCWQVRGVACQNKDEGTLFLTGFKTSALGNDTERNADLKAYNC